MIIPNENKKTVILLTNNNESQILLVSNNENMYDLPIIDNYMTPIVCSVEHVLSELGLISNIDIISPQNPNIVSVLKNRVLYDVILYKKCSNKQVDLTHSIYSNIKWLDTFNHIQYIDDNLINLSMISLDIIDYYVKNKQTIGSMFNGV